MTDSKPFTEQNPPAEKLVPTPEQLADQFAALAVKVALLPEPDGLDVLNELAQKALRPKVAPTPSEAAEEKRRLILDMDLRILRQQRRIQKIQINREGPADEMQERLEEMIRARELLQAQMDDLAREGQKS
jgi:hypothetical protein